MNNRLRSVCLVCKDLEGSSLRLQPWRYVSEVAYGLVEQGHQLTVVTNKSVSFEGSQICRGVVTKRLKTINNPWWKTNTELNNVIRAANPEILIWHVGLSSFLHQNFSSGIGRPNIGIFTTPIYTWNELAQIGIKRLAHSYRFTSIHVINSLIPRHVLRERMLASGLQTLVVQTETARKQLREEGLWERDIELIRPGVDACWVNPGKERALQARQELGYSPDNVVLVYFGSAEPLRGLPVLLSSFEQAVLQNSNLRLLVIIRSRSEVERQEERLERLITESPVRAFIKLQRGFFEPDRLSSLVSAGDIVVLPFMLVPSDSPLSLLEAHAIGRPTITTRMACLPEMAALGIYYLAEPGETASLTQAILRVAHYVGKVDLTDLEAIVYKGTKLMKDMGREWSELVQRL